MLRASTAIKQTRMLTGCFLKVIFFAVHVHGLLEIDLNTKKYSSRLTRRKFKHVLGPRKNIKRQHFY